jgi:glucokinase
MALSLGFDLGGTQLRAAVAENGQILRQAATATDTPGGPEAVMMQIKEIAREVCEGDWHFRISGIGIASPGPIDTDSGIVDHIPSMPGWSGFPLRQRMKELFGVPVFLENDAIAAAYGEWKQGAGRGLKHVVYVTVSTGIGGGVILDGRLVHGRRGMAGHIGHLHLAMSGPRCSCGGTGCFEAFASGTALGVRAREAASSGAVYLARAAARGIVNSRDVVEGAQTGDEVCVALLKEEARYLGAGFASLANLFSPELIIMGGGVSAAFDLMQDDIRAVFRDEALAPQRSVKIVAAELGGNAGLIGAVLLGETQGES